MVHVTGPAAVSFTGGSCVTGQAAVSFTGGSYVTGRVAVSFAGGSCVTGQAAMYEIYWWFMSQVLLVVHVSLVKWLMYEFY